MTNYIYYTYRVPVLKTIRIEVAPDSTAESLLGFFEEWGDIDSGVTFLSQATNNIVEVEEEIDEREIKPQYVLFGDESDEELSEVACWIMDYSSPMTKRENRFIHKEE